MLKKYVSLKFCGRAESLQISIGNQISIGKFNFDVRLLCLSVLMFINNGPDVVLYHILKLSVPASVGSTNVKMLC